MIKKLFAIVLLISLIVTPVVFADMTSGVNFKTMTFNNTGGGYLTTYVSTTTFPLRYKVIGFEIIWKQAASENVVALHDTTAALGITNTSLFGEAETREDSFNGMWYPFPKQLENGLCVVQGGGTVVYVYYVTY